MTRTVDPDLQQAKARVRRVFGVLFRLGCSLLFLALAAGLFLFWRSSPEPLPPGSETIERVVAGPYVVGSEDFEWTDTTRPTDGYEEYLGGSERALPATVWFPLNSDEAEVPLVVYSHGFGSVRSGGRYLAEHLASYGYLVVAADYPLSHLRAPAMNADDVVNQPADVSFLIDQALELGTAAHPFAVSADSSRIGVVGLSLGGLTSTLVTFHLRWRDPRVRAAISLGGPGDIFSDRFFSSVDKPFLMIAGTADAIVEYGANAAVMPQRIQRGGLLTLEGGTHIGFDQLARGPFRLFGHPDRTACFVARADPHAAPEHPFSGKLGTAEEGLLAIEEYALPCLRRYDQYLNPVRQQLLTRVATHAFFESHFARNSEERKHHQRFLEESLEREIDEVTFEPGGAEEVSAQLLGEE